ncbi:ABC transporter permease subunit [Jeotgalibacillus terrae]|uniref:ABC transporter permease subunit n=1 Tax=Jeotgalibacillus terrae TaxID=587735 RepID=A0ABW5ZLC3_9BACL|nr:ABC transporter permease subunit [Jeotgalibacillus terrae]MBM7578055.1 peptide/nickel transport system permease protein [Jeotgalibacillus terrae]
MKNKSYILILIPSALFLLVAASFIYEWGFNEDTEVASYQTNEAGEILTHPYPPSFDHPLGTDRKGQDLLLRILNGAKYTILFVLSVGLVRMIAGMLLGALLTFMPKRIKDFVQLFLTPYVNVPAFILVYFLAYVFFAVPTDDGGLQLIFIQFVILTSVGVPSLVLLFSNEFQDGLKHEYIQASYQLGATKKHIVIRHLLPVLRNRFTIVFLQQIIASLILLIHLGVFRIYIGGQAEGSVSFDEEILLSKSGEWAGMIGQSVFDIVTAPWIVLAPGMAFVLLIVMLNTMIRLIRV